MNLALVAAAGLSLLTWAIHTFIGSREIAAPLMRSDLAGVPKYTVYYCWHVVTLVLFAMALGFAYAACVPASIALGVFLTVLSGAFMAWSLALVVTGERTALELPQWSLFAAITGAGVVGVLG